MKFACQFFIETQFIFTNYFFHVHTAFDCAIWIIWKNVSHCKVPEPMLRFFPEYSVDILKNWVNFSGKNISEKNTAFQFLIHIYFSDVYSLYSIHHGSRKYISVLLDKIYRNRKMSAEVPWKHTGGFFFIYWFFWINVSTCVALNLFARMLENVPNENIDEEFNSKILSWVKKSIVTSSISKILDVCCTAENNYHIKRDP